MKEQLKLFISESLLEFGRVAELSVYPVLLTGINLQTGDIAINWLLVKALLVVAALKGLDKGLHKTGIAEKGLARF